MRLMRGIQIVVRRILRLHSARAGGTPLTPYPRSGGALGGMLHQPMSMEQPRGRNYKTLAVVVVLAAMYIGWLITQRTITGIPRLDGIIGVLLGLFICSRPAANYLDLLFSRGRIASDRSLIGWLALNGVVMFVGWLVITIGATRLIE
jgi:hypothetical protein